MSAKKIEIGDDVISPDEFDAIKLSVASPDDILDWSHGEVQNSETINYRTQKPERDGLFDEKIFGPQTDYECYCGKYKGIRYKGVTCDKCGVEITTSKVRRRRMGHIELAVPCSHPWYVRGVSSVMANVLGISSNDLEKVLYFGAFIITNVDEKLLESTEKQLEQELQQYKAKLSGKAKKSDQNSKKGKLSEAQREEKLENIMEAYDRAKKEMKMLEPMNIISEMKYHEISRKYGKIVEVGIGAEAIEEILTNFDLKEEIEKLIKQKEDFSGKDEPKKLIRRLNLLRSLDQNNIRPEWMIYNHIPVLPPDLRPMVQLDGGRFAASDLNDLYRRVINRNNRLKRLIEKGAPEVIQRNEKRMLQEAVDALVDNKSGQSQIGRRPLRSLSDLIKGKKGRFRRNLLGKRVDYSGRSVIVVGPELKFNQCGIPKTMALELFKPFIIQRLIKEEYAHNIKNATRMINNGEEQVWDMLEEVVKDYPVALNRAPTLHRLGIQTFKPVLVEGKSIRIHPLVCEAYNADFDGDQMAVYVPVTDEAKKEAEEIMMSTRNLIKPATGKSIVNPRQDMIFGLYYLTLLQDKGLGAGKVFADSDEAVLMHRNKKLGVASKIKVKIDDQLIETSVGRILFNEILPEDMSFINQPIDRGQIGSIVDHMIEKYPNKQVVEVIDNIKQLGFYYATHSGLSFSLGDINVPKDKPELIQEAQKDVDEINEQYQQGLITEDERYSMIVNRWTKAKDDLDEKMEEGFDVGNSIYTMVDSGSRGSMAQLSQLAAMKGMVVNPAGEVIELPITPNYKEGFTSNDYFVSSHGTRKGRTDTALRTAEAGYLTRRLIDVSQDLIVTEEDCKTTTGLTIDLSDKDEFDRDLSQQILGRVLAGDIKDSNGKVAIKKNQEISSEIISQIKKIEPEEVEVYSPLTCQSSHGICQKCYGHDLSTHEMVELGTAIGIIAAQSIGEPGTQLTMRTFHVGGVAGEDITQGLPRVEEVLEARSPRSPAILADIDGTIEVKEDEENEKKVISIVSGDKKETDYRLKRGYEPVVKDGEEVKGGQKIIERPKGGDIKADFRATVKLSKEKLTLVSFHNIRQNYTVSPFISLTVKQGTKVRKGQQITEGHVDLQQQFEVSGQEEVQKYILGEVQKIYISQGQIIHDKHFEVIIKKMFSQVRIISPGDSDFVVGSIEGRQKVIDTNERLKKSKKETVKYEELLQGISNVALNTESFLSAASFQETTRVLIEAAMNGQVDELNGLKENVMVGRLIPAGTGYKKSKSK
jgi:DNA-directed RNA polymerase subunit beta'